MRCSDWFWMLYVEWKLMRKRQNGNQSITVEPTIFVDRCARWSSMRILKNTYQMPVPFWTNKQEKGVCYCLCTPTTS